MYSWTRSAAESVGKYNLKLLQGLQKFKLLFWYLLCCCVLLEALGVWPETMSCFHNLFFSFLGKNESGKQFCFETEYLLALLHCHKSCLNTEGPFIHIVLSKPHQSSERMQFMFWTVWLELLDRVIESLDRFSTFDVATVTVLRIFLPVKRTPRVPALQLSTALLHSLSHTNSCSFKGTSGNSFSYHYSTFRLSMTTGSMTVFLYTQSLVLL